MSFLKKEEGIEYTEAILETLNSKDQREMAFDKQNDFYYATIFYASGGPASTSPGKDLEQAMTRVFTSCSPPWFSEEITFHNKHALERLSILIDRFGSVRIRKHYCEIEIFLGESKEPVTGDYGHLQEVLRYAMKEKAPERKSEVKQGTPERCGCCCDFCAR